MKSLLDKVGLSLFLIIMLVSCEKKETNSIESNINSDCTVEANQYENISDNIDLVKYFSDVSTNLPVENGIIICPYYNLEINGQAIPVYSTRTANSIHSFSYVDVDRKKSDSSLSINVKLNFLDESTALKKRKPSVVVLPESKNVVSKLENGIVSATIKEFGSYSFVFNNSQDQALTLFVAEKENQEELFTGKQVKYFEAGDYTSDDKKNTFMFSEENKVYYFKKGKYKIDRITIPSNSILYFEQGAYLEVYPISETYVISSSGTRNVKILGRGLLDFSKCCGGEVPEGYHNNKGGVQLSEIDGLEFSGLTCINSQTWTLCFTDCKNLSVHDCMLFGYRVYSDGVMLSDCKNALVERNFARTGDDAFETKSTSSNGLTENVIFKNNAAWTDKAIAYGCVYESRHDTKGVKFIDCSVGFALGSWSNHIGCCCVQMGDRKGAIMSDISFENIEVFNSSNPAIMNLYIGGSGGRGEGYGIIKNIYFKNITARRNYGAFLNLRTYDSVNCFIYDVYVDNVVSNGVKLTSENCNTNDYIIDYVAGGYDYKRLKINTLE